MPKNNYRTALYTSKQTRLLDQLAIQQCKVTGRELMQLAGERAFYWIQQRFPEAATVVVVCGRGNNGGDGYVVAELMRQAELKVCVVRDAPAQSADCISACQDYLDAGGLVVDDFLTTISNADLIVDGLFGAGLSRAPAGLSAEIVNTINESSCVCVALDIPTGLSCDTGLAFTPTLCADLTVTFIGKKVGLITGDGPDYCGELILETLDIDEQVFDQVAPTGHILNKTTPTPRKHNSHKAHYGNLVVAGGDSGMLGAVLLAGRAALRSGCGLVNVLSNEKHYDMPAVYQAELMSHIFESAGDAHSLLESCTALIIGPGTCDNHWGNELFTAVIAYNIPKVIDAGGLRVLANRNIQSEDHILTPHPGEAAVLLDVDTSAIQLDRVEAAKNIVKKYGGVCVLKGVGTIICDAKSVYVCALGNPGMASAGLGDVLSGIIGALLAQGKTPIRAAREGVWLHAHSADLCAKALGQEYLLASDVIAGLSNAMRA